jgi:hypothetical protein
MGKRAARSRRQGVVDQSFRIRNIRLCPIGHLVEDTRRERCPQCALCLDRTRIEYQCALEQPDCGSIIFTRRRQPDCRTSAENVIQRVRLLDWFGGFRRYEFKIEGGRDPTGDVVLDSE